MKKKLIAMLLVCAMLASLSACGSQKDTQPSDTEPLSDAGTQETDVLCTGAPENSGSMLSVFDALIRSITENNMPYDPEDPAAFWTELAYLIDRDGYKSPNARINGENNLVLPAKAVQEYAAAMFVSYDREENLPEMPRDDMMLRYNEEKDTYTLQPSDFSDAEIQVVSCKAEGNDVYTLRADYVSSEDQTVLSTWEIVMAKDNDAAEDALYHYRVADICCLLSNTQSAAGTPSGERSETSSQTQENDTITLDDAVDILYGIGSDRMNLDRALDDCFISPDGSTASIEGHTCYAINVYEDVSQDNLLGSYYVRTDGKGIYAYNNVTNEYNEIS